MKLTIEIAMDGEAFNEGSEAGRILAKLASIVDDMEPGAELVLLDINGNVVGFAKVTK